MKNEIIGKLLLHTCHVRNKSNEAVVVSELEYYQDGTTKPHLRVIRNPKRAIYVTKPKFRNHTLKKEREQIEKLDKYVVPDKDINSTVFKALNGYSPKGYVDKSVLDSPYVYGGTASIEYLVKRKYVSDFKKTGLLVKDVTVGCLDTEYSLLADSMGELVCLTVTHENKVYTAINAKFFNKYNPTTKQREYESLDNLKQLSHDILVPLIEEMFNENKSLSKMKDKLPFTFDYHVGIDEVDTLRWIFDKIHENKTSFINIWNMDYDISMIFKSLERSKVDPKELFCSDEINKEFQSCFYKKDRKIASHITDIWNWLKCTSYTQYYDAMPVYAKLRTAKGKESSYALDYILKINGIEGKLKFDVKDDIVPGSPDWHRYMVKNEILKYIIYNQADSIWLQLTMWAVKDPVNFMSLSGITPLEKTFKQTLYVHDSLYDHWEKSGYIMGTVGNTKYNAPDDDTDEEDDAKGGAVLSPYLINYDLGMSLSSDILDLKTSIFSYGNDFDFSQFYPRTNMLLDVCKETKQYTVVSINNDTDVEKFFSMYSNHKANCIKISKTYFDLPGYEEMEQLVLQRL